jgi:hypothetical protein
MGSDSITARDALLQMSDHSRFHDWDIHVHFLFLHAHGAHTRPARTGILIARVSN